MTVTFELEGQEFIALNGGPVFTFSPAVSFFMNCEAQEEVGRLWEKLYGDGVIEKCVGLKISTALWVGYGYFKGK
jgi:predicted 3-demethylubiquinone-9 3-methyltransferase (glyoxalase superfamily)